MHAEGLPLPYPLREYTFTTLIGRGGYSNVYLATKCGSPAQFVAKVSSFDHPHASSTRRAYFNESNALFGLSHPRIIRLYDNFVEGNLAVLILEYCPGGCLKDEMNQLGGRLSLDRFCTVCRQIVSAIQFCHANNIAHHDIKPQNVLMDSTHRVKLSDFGLAFKKDEYHPFCNTFSGSLIYTAPEIFRKQPHDAFKSDVWALGIMFLVLFSGSNPWETNDKTQIVTRIKTGTYSVPSKIPKELIILIRRMTEINPSERISIDEVAEFPLFKDSVITTHTLPDPLSPRARKIEMQTSGNIPFFSLSDVNAEDLMSGCQGEDDSELFQSVGSKIFNNKSISLIREQKSVPKVLMWQPVTHPSNRSQLAARVRSKTFLDYLE